MVSDVGDVVALGGHLPQRATVAKGQPVHLSARQSQPERHSVSIPPHLEAAAVAAHHTRQLAVCAVREVVQVVTCDQVFGVQVGTILSEGERDIVEDSASANDKTCKFRNYQVLCTLRLVIC